MLASIHGKQFEVADQPADYWGWIREGRYDREWKVYDDHLRPEHAFVDLGAWVGAHSLYASRTTKRVYAVEPDPVAFAILTENVKREPIHICCGAIAGYHGKVTLGSGMLGASTTRKNLKAGGGIGEATETCEAECTTLRNFLQWFVEPGLFIKMDIEGGEEEVFRDLALFEELRPTLLVEIHPFWWEDPETPGNFERLKSLYQNSAEVFHGTWILK